MTCLYRYADESQCTSECSTYSAALCGFHRIDEWIDVDPLLLSPNVFQIELGLLLYEKVMTPHYLLADKHMIRRELRGTARCNWNVNPKQHAGWIALADQLYRKYGRLV